MSWLWFRRDDVINWKHFSRCWSFVRGIHRWPVDSPHKCQWRGALKFSLICNWIKGWANNRDVGDLRRHRAHYNVTVMVLVQSGHEFTLVIQNWFSGTRAVNSKVCLSNVRKIISVYQVTLFSVWSFQISFVINMILYTYICCIVSLVNKLLSYLTTAERNKNAIYVLISWNVLYVLVIHALWWLLGCIFDTNSQTVLYCGGEAFTSHCCSVNNDTSKIRVGYHGCYSIWTSTSTEFILRF